MKGYADATLDEIEAGTAIDVGAVDILCDPPVHAWGGLWPLPIGDVVYEPLGDHGLIGKDGAGLGNVAQPLTLELSGVDPAVLELLDADEVKDAPVILKRLIFNGAGTQLLEVDPIRRGRLDQLQTEETIGGTATIRAVIEGAARALGRRTGRMRTDADQRLIDADDGGMKHVSFAGLKMLYWGGQPPTRAGAALGGQPSVPGGPNGIGGLNYAF